MKELVGKYVGKKGRVFVGGLSVEVTVKDVAIAWGHERYLVSPIAGAGEVWVERVNLS